MMAFNRMIDEHTYWVAVIQPRWRETENWEKYLRIIAGTQRRAAGAARVRRRLPLPHPQRVHERRLGPPAGRCDLPARARRHRRAVGLPRRQAVLHGQTSRAGSMRRCCRSCATSSTHRSAFDTKDYAASKKNLVAYMGSHEGSLRHLSAASPRTHGRDTPRMIDLYYYTSPERPQGVDDARGGRPALSRCAGPTSAPATSTSEAYGAINPNRQDPGPDRPRWPGRTADHAVRIRRHPALPGREDRAPAADRPARRWNVIKWLFWQTSSQGPLLGQAAHFVSHAPPARHRCPVRGRALSQRGRVGSMACWRRSSPAGTTSTASSRSPTSPPFPGCASRRARA